VPVTTCTDLLKTGGYGRLPAYLHDLEEQMLRVQARTVDEFILNARGQREAARGDVTRAAFLNTVIIVAESQADERYQAHNNRSIPKRINSHLTTFDCITCDKCIPVCPNDANFSYHTGEVRISYRDVEVRPDGIIAAIGVEKHFALEQGEQIANFADYCNYCGNCDTFCPEYDGPYLKKPNFFGSRRAFDAAAPRDGFLLELVGGQPSLIGRIEGMSHHLQQLDAGGGYKYQDGELEVVIDQHGTVVRINGDLRLEAPHRIDMGRFHCLAALLRGITDRTRVHAVNTPLLAAVEQPVSDAMR
jgi:putative selenate reductase